MYNIGIDVGSVAAKAVILKNGEIAASAVQPTGWNPKDSGREVFQKAVAKAGITADSVRYIVGTGYGRVAMGFVDKAVTEITCHALGASHWYPENNLVIDIGGQDSKAILINNQGKVENFVMNDKCAAGTGRFLQVMALTLGLELDQLSEIITAEPVNINSMCTVFAESEVISLLAAGEAKERIVAGLYHSVARRISTMTGSLGLINGVTFTGGVAKNQGMCKILSDILGCKVNVPEEPQIIGALGAAILASRVNC